jgi:N-acetylglucosamine-6-phosphate deacetylase
MSQHAIAGARILAKGQWLEGYALLIEHGLICAICPADALPLGVETELLNGGSLLPGFIDTQVNGGGGVLLNDEPTVEGIAAIAQAHRAFGTTALLPTLISDDLDVIARAIAATAKAIELGVPGVLGIHIEGPFLNPLKHGIHDPAKIRALDDRAIGLLSSLDQGKTLVTLAPECLTPGAIAALTARGVVVAAGHSLATYEEMARAVAEGLTGVTHLYNAMTQLGSREPGLVGAAMDLGLTSGLIVDGHHVHPAALRTALRVLGKEQVMLVTDAMSTVGTDMDGFLLGAQQIDRQDGVLRGPDGTLAGSDLDMSQAFRNALCMMRIDMITASHMASTTPAAFLGLSSSHGTIGIGMRADLVLLDNALNSAATWIAGARY